MLLKHTDIQIPDDGTTDPFINCKLDRKPFAQVLTSIVSSYTEGFVIAIDNEWGSGKTTFVKMWQQQLKNEGYKTMYFNAWENDFQEDVIIALLSELEEFRDEAKTDFNNLLQKTATFLKKAAPAVAKGVVSKAIGDEALADIASAVTEFTTEEVENKIRSFNDKKKGIEDFKDILADYVEKIDNQKPLVFIVDELDRCRPSYSVEVLEQIKHLFAVPGIIFVLSIDKLQLGNAIRGFYGSDLINADEYLRRFIDLDYRIPKPSTQNFIEYLYGFFKFYEFIGSQSRPNDFQRDQDTLKIISLLLYSKSGLNLRQIEKQFARVRLALRAFTHRQYVFPEILIFISFLEIKHPILLNKIRERKIPLNELVEKLDSILIPFCDSTNIRRVRFLYSSFLVRYERSYITAFRRPDEGLVDRSNTSDLKLYVSSRLEDENNNLLQAVEYYHNQMDTYNIGLEFILEKYDLTQNLRT